MVAPLFGDEADQDREGVEAVVPVMLSDPGVVGAVATETVMVAVVVPLPFTAVKVYRVVVERAGVVVLLPVTVPILGLMDREVALATVQLSVEVPFRATTAGEAVNEEMVGEERPLRVVPDAVVEEAELLPTLSLAVNEEMVGEERPLRVVPDAVVEEAELLP